MWFGIMSQQCKIYHIYILYIFTYLHICLERQQPVSITLLVIESTFWELPLKPIALDMRKCYLNKTHFL